jgi:hypothetical protein
MATRQGVAAAMQLLKRARPVPCQKAKSSASLKNAQSAEPVTPECKMPLVPAATVSTSITA